MSESKSSLPGTDQWPNVAKEAEPASINHLFGNWLVSVSQDRNAELSYLEAFRAGYEEGRKALDRP
jgi:hypothetical protein